VPWKLSRYTHVLRLSEGRSLLYNGASGAIVELSPKGARRAQRLFQRIEAGETPSQRNAFFDDMVTGQFVVQHDVDELFLLKRRYEHERKKSQFLFTILPTFACNLGCGYCFVGKKSGVMSREVQDSIVAFAADRMAKHRANMHVDWFGGEPLLGLDVIERLSDAFQVLCKKHRVKYRAQVISNGTVVTDRTVQVLKNAAVDRVQISIDGPATVHDARRPYKNGARSSFDTIMQNLERLVGRFMIRLRINVDARNLDDVWTLLALFEDRGWIGPDTEFFPYLARVSAFTDACASMSPLMCTIDDFYRAQFKWLDRLKRQGVAVSHHGLYELPEPKLYNCGAVGSNGFVFAPNGEIHKCGLEVDVSDRAIGRLGDALDPTNANALRFDNYSPFEREMCRECEFLPSCLGGCPRDHMEGHEQEIRDNCEYHKRFENQLLLFHLGHRAGTEQLAVASPLPVSAKRSSFIPLVPVA
jgi:uncharacterized protein